jgi:hypothetical protein
MEELFTSLLFILLFYKFVITGDTNELKEMAVFIWKSSKENLMALSVNR